MANLQEHKLRLDFDPCNLDSYSEVLDNIATVVKQFIPLLNGHKIDEFN